MPPPRSQHDIERQREAEAVLQRATLGSELIGSSTLSRREPVAQDNDDAIEVWGRRIGRSLGVIAVLIILWQLARMLLTRT